MISMLTGSIDPCYHLQRDSRDWILADNVKIRAKDRHSFGFSLDNSRNPPLSFFSRNPTEHIAKMCDAIIAQLDDDVLYFLVIEQKSGNKDDADKQLANGKFFCQWLISLYDCHGYWDVRKVEYIGLLVWRPRRSEDKDGTSHRAMQPQTHPLFSRYYSIENRTEFSLRDLLPKH